MRPTVSTASSVLPKFHPGFMPAKWVFADMALNFALEGHVTAVTLPDGNATSQLVGSHALLSRLTHPVLRQVHLGAMLLQAPDQMCSEPLSLWQSIRDVQTSSSEDFRSIYTMGKGLSYCRFCPHLIHLGRVLIRNTTPRFLHLHTPS